MDCQEVAEKPIKAANNITLEGYEVLGKMSKHGGGRKQSATVSVCVCVCVCMWGEGAKNKPKLKETRDTNQSETFLCVEEKKKRTKAILYVLSEYRIPYRSLNRSHTKPIWAVKENREWDCVGREYK